MAITTAAMRDQIYSDLGGIMASGSLALPVLYPDKGDQLPATPQDLNAYKGRPFIIATILHQRSNQIAIGRPKKVRSDVELHLEIATPSGNGMAQSDAISGILRSGFTGLNSSDVRYRAPQIKELDRNSLWQSTLVVIPFDFDEEL